MTAGPTSLGLFDDVFSENSTGDALVCFSRKGLCDVSEVRVHSAVVRKIGALSTILDEGGGPPYRLTIEYDPDVFLNVLRYLYTGAIELSEATVCSVLGLCATYDLEGLLDGHIFPWLENNFSTSLFFKLCEMSGLVSGGFGRHATFRLTNPEYVSRLNVFLNSALISSRRRFVGVVWDPWFLSIDVPFVVSLMSSDNLPIVGEEELFSILTHYAKSQKHRDCDNVLSVFRPPVSGVRLSGNYSLSEAEDTSGSVVTHLHSNSFSLDYHQPPSCFVAPLTNITLPGLLGFLGILDSDAADSAFCSAPARRYVYPLDPPFFVVKSDVTAVGLGHGAPANAIGTVDLSSTNVVMGPKEFLQQDPGWIGAGVYELALGIDCQSWAHREKVSNRMSSRRESPVTRSTSFKVAKDDLQFHYGGEGALGKMDRSVARSAVADWVAQDRIEHVIICGVRATSTLEETSSGEKKVIEGSVRRGVRITQRDKESIYRLCDLADQKEVTVGGTTTAVQFRLRLVVSDTDDVGLCKCVLSVLPADSSVKGDALLEQEFTSSGQVSHHFYVSCVNFDQNSSYKVELRWIDSSRMDSPDTIRPTGSVNMATAMSEKVSMTRHDMAAAGPFHGRSSLAEVPEEEQEKVGDEGDDEYESDQQRSPMVWGV